MYIEKEEPTYHLNIGEIIVCPNPSVISTILGSCVSVCLYSKKSRMGGMIHYAHPRMLSKYGQEEDFRYGEIAIVTLVKELEAITGEDHSHFVAKIIGGAGEIDGVQVSYEIGAANVKIAKEILRELKIPIVGEDVGGSIGRKVLFYTGLNRLRVASINSSEDRDNRALAANLSIVKDSFQSKKVVAPTKSRYKKRKVLIVDDSRTIRDLIKRILSEDQEFEIIGSAVTAIEAEKMVHELKPDVITLDIRMPIMTGLEWLEKLLPNNPIPVVIVSTLQLEEGNEVFRALELGAIDYIQKPTLADLPVFGPQFREKVKEASFAKVLINGAPRKVDPVIFSEADMHKVLVIGASTGGTEALKFVMASLPERIPPTLIVQHIPPVFSKAFADRLNEMCPFEVKEAKDGDKLRPSCVLIAPGGKQMKVESAAGGLRVRITDDAPVNRHKPSVDYLFRSVATAVGKNSVGVILTGMGNDGAQGLLEMRKNGSATIAQDEGSSVVYGMPKAAFEIGAAEKVVSLNAMARQILLAVGHRNGK